VAASFQLADSSESPSYNLAATQTGKMETCRHESAPLVVGLIGGIGSGKSAVAEDLARRGAVVIRADQLGHEALRQPEVSDAVVRRWGREVLDEQGSVDRKKLAAIVFGDPAQRRALEELVHPWIGRRIEEEIARARTRPDVPLIVLDAAVMVEAGWVRACDRVVFVDADEDVRRERLTRRGWAGDELARREAAQLPLTEKRHCADHVLDNSTTLEHLRRQVDELLCRWGRMPAHPAHAGPWPPSTS
jgi:dephospho-CoA kinase